MSKEWGEVARIMGVQTIEQAMAESLQIVSFVLTYQSLGEKIASLNKHQVRLMDRYDLTGCLYLPSYLGEEK